MEIASRYMPGATYTVSPDDAPDALNAFVTVLHATLALVPVFKSEPVGFT